MKKQLFEKYDGSQVTESMLQEASQLFGENYGTWGEHAAQAVGEFLKAGKLALDGFFCLLRDNSNRVRLGKRRLRSKHLPDGAICSYVRVTVDGSLAGHVFACRWTYDNKTVCWVTQLVVHRDYRERGLATGLLNQLRRHDDVIYGIMSSHPAACLAAAKAFGSTRILVFIVNLMLNITGHITTVRCDFIREHAERLMRASPIRYVKEAKLRGSLFNPEHSGGLVSSVDTGFWVDHTEPLEALAWARDNVDWPLGELHEGHEFLLVSEVTRRPRSRSGTCGFNSS